MRRRRFGSAGLIAFVLLVLVLGRVAGCGGDDGDTDDDGDAETGIEVVVSDESSPIVDLRELRCHRDGDTGYGAAGVARSKGDGPHYVNIAVRFVDADGVRIELLTDSVSDLQPAESARWDVSSSTEAAREIRRCEVTATVS